MGRRLSIHVSNQVGFSGPAVWTNHEAGSSWGRAERKLRDAKEEREEANEKDDQFSSINSPIQRDVEEERSASLDSGLAGCSSRAGFSISICFPDFPLKGTVTAYIAIEGLRIVYNICEQRCRL
ncbi:hypothetical protein ZIOFF_003225 [Zingiber officinale]|uniref:Uncharacterized protein n=1 Tax=Zingiber officinale TaxID=94328 RepID=A0A8J5IN65_ZINOF|nr:hypothetical protein ZIOFF_003225 [Zingiber officinale]